MAGEDGTRIERIKRMGTDRNGEQNADDRGWEVWFLQDNIKERK